MANDREDGIDAIIDRSLQTEMEESYVRYSMSVIRSRALPDVRDGLKPSQRRILYAMKQLNLSANAKPRKCAKICGDTSGNWHPHGESVIYPTLARMAQHWVMRYRLIDGQGNFGSVDGDPPAAMRYTEARLTASAMALMEDLEKETVDFTPNYDETDMEPTVFPAKYPNLLAMGSSGIAVALATNIPPHNLTELIEATKKVVNNPDTTIDEIMEAMPGPDFPTGGVICGLSGIKEAYHTGRGKVIVRAVVDVEEMKEKGRQQLVVTEIPYNVNKAELIIQVADLIKEEKIKGISDLRDESDKEGMRIVFELKKNEFTEAITNQLFRFTNMQVTFGCNMMAIDNGMPKCMNVKELLSAWVRHRLEVIIRRTQFDLAKAEARAHILEGYLKALDHLDEVVALIRKSASREDAKQQLIQRFEFSERQATSVLELRLYQITALEKDKINDEYQELKKKIEYYLKVLSDENERRLIITNELDEVKDQRHHISERKTKIIPAEGEFNEEDLIPDVRVFVTLTLDGWIKRLPENVFREQRRGGHGVIAAQKKEDDVIKSVYLANNHDFLLIFTNLGRCYWLKVWKIMEGTRQSKGKPLVNYLPGLQEGERVATILPVSEFDPESSACIIYATKKGVVKKTLLDAYSNPRQKGVQAIEIRDGDELISASLIEGTQQVMIFTQKGLAVRFDNEKVRPMGRTATGVKGVDVKEGDAVVAMEVVTPDQKILTVCENGYGKISKIEDFRQTNRGAKGVTSIKTSERNGLVVGACALKGKESLLLMSQNGQTIRISLSQLRTIGRTSQGVKLVELDKKDKLVAVERIDFTDEAEEE